MPFCSIYLKIVHSLQTRHYNQKVSSKISCETSVLQLATQRHIWHILYFIPCIYLKISWVHPPNLSSCINLVITKSKLRSQCPKLKQLWPFSSCIKFGFYLAVLFDTLIIKLSKICFFCAYTDQMKIQQKIWWFAPPSFLGYFY